MQQGGFGALAVFLPWSRYLAELVFGKRFPKGHFPVGLRDM